MRQEKDPELSKTRREAGNRAFQVNHDQRQRDTQAGTFKEVIKAVKNCCDPNMAKWDGNGWYRLSRGENSATLHPKCGRVKGYLSFLREVGQSQPMARKA